MNTAVTVMGVMGIDGNGNENHIFFNQYDGFSFLKAVVYCLMLF